MASATHKSPLIVTMAVCGNDQPVAQQAVRSAIWGLGGDYALRFAFVDDASPTQLGQQLAEYCRQEGIESQYTTLPQSLGFRGCIRRTLIGLNLAWSIDPAAELVIKMDPDAFVLRQDLGSDLRIRMGDPSRPAIGSVCRRPRRRDALLYLADLLPAGFRRASENGQIVRRWELKRGRPVWWWRFGLRAILRGSGFRFAGGAFYALTRGAMQQLAASGALACWQDGRHGFLCSEEDVLVSTLVLGSGGRLVEFERATPGWGHYAMGSLPELLRLAEGGAFVVHPIKAPGPLLEAVASRWHDL